MEPIKKRRSPRKREDIRNNLPFDHKENKLDTVITVRIEKDLKARFFECVTDLGIPKKEAVDAAFRLFINSHPLAGHNIRTARQPKNSGRVLAKT